MSYYNLGELPYETTTCKKNILNSLCPICEECGIGTCVDKPKGTWECEEPLDKKGRCPCIPKGEGDTGCEKDKKGKCGPPSTCAKGSCIGLSVWGSGYCDSDKCCCKSDGTNSLQSLGGICDVCGLSDHGDWPSMWNKTLKGLTCDQFNLCQSCKNCTEKSPFCTRPWENKEDIKRCSYILENAIGAGVYSPEKSCKYNPGDVVFSTNINTNEGPMIYYISKSNTLSEPSRKCSYAGWTSNGWAKDCHVDQTPNSCLQNPFCTCDLKNGKCAEGTCRPTNNTPGMATNILPEYLIPLKYTPPNGKTEYLCPSWDSNTPWVNLDKDKCQ